MINHVKAFACALVVGALMNFDAGLAYAQPFAGSMRGSISASEAARTVQPAQYRNGRGYGGRGYRGRRGGNGAGIALGIGAAIIGGIVLSEAARAEHHSSHGDQWDRCANTYRSFDSSSGLYTGYDGVRRTCPYLQ